MKTSTMTLTLSLSVAATLLLSLSVAANAENYFNRIASFPTYQNIPAEEDRNKLLAAAQLNTGLELAQSLAA